MITGLSIGDAGTRGCHHDLDLLQLDARQSKQCRDDRADTMMILAANFSIHAMTGMFK
jgi:hypothetical protein